MLILISSLIINLFFWLVIFFRLSQFETNKDITISSDQNDSSIRIIICIRNEAENLIQYLPKILKQDVGKYYVTVIDDYSTDDSFSILQEFENKYEHLTVHQNNIRKGKKLSVHEYVSGIEEDILVYTDGDCIPDTDSWLRLMTDPCKGEKSIVLGYGPFLKEKGLLNNFARFECTLTAIQYLSYALSGIPYMGVGRNLVYRKDLFTAQNGFYDHLEVLSGDDDLFINQVANKENTTIQIDPGSFMYSKAPDTWKDFFRQKRRHISTSHNYRFIHKILLSLFAGSHIIFYLTVLFVPFSIFISFWLIRIIAIGVSQYSSFKKLEVKELIKFLPLLDVMLALYYLTMTVFSILPPSKKW